MLWSMLNRRLKKSLGCFALGATEETNILDSQFLWQVNFINLIETYPAVIPANK